MGFKLATANCWISIFNNCVLFIIYEFPLLKRIGDDFQNLEASLNRALFIASNFNLKYAKVEHLLLALTKDVDVNYVLSRCNIRADEIISMDNILSRCNIKANDYNNNIKGFLQSSSELIISGVKPSSMFQCIIHRAIIRAHSLGKKK